MKITKSQLKEIIKEELNTALVQEDNSPPQMDIADAIQMLEAEEDISGTLFQVINRLQIALEKLGGQEKEIPVRNQQQPPSGDWS